jgi:hypothetical protein
MRVRSSVDVRVDGLLLAAAAKECRTACLCDALHHAPAALGWARLSFTAIYGKGVLKVAKCAVSGTIIAQRGAAGRDGVIQHISDQWHETRGTAARLAPGCRKAGGKPPRAEFCPVKRLTHIDIAKACDVPLVEQKRLEVSGSPVRSGRDVCGVQLIAERLDTHFRKMPACVDIVSGHKVHEAKPSRVIVGDAGAVFEMEHDMIVNRAFASLVGEFSWARRELIRRFDGEPTAHAKMHDERFAPLYFSNEIFGTPAEPRYFPALDASDKFLGK